MNRKIIHILIFSLISGTLIAQNSIQNDLFTKFQNLTSQNGLSNDLVMDIVQDNFGYIWIATGDGLNRYDGYSFVHYKNNLSDSTSISDNFITSLEIDQNNNLWVGTSNGLNLYVRQNNNFERFTKNIGKNSLADNYIRQLLAEENFLWIETLDGTLNKLDLSRSEFSFYKHPAVTQPYYYYHSIFRDRQNLLWIGGRNLGPAFLDEQSNEFTFITEFGNKKGQKRDPDVACYYEDSYGNFWIGATDGLYNYKKSEDLFDKVLSTSTFDIVEDKSHNLWLGTGYGLYQYNIKTNVFTLYENIENNDFSLIHNHINKLFYDKNQNLWIATNRGISILSYYQNRFKHIFHIPGYENTPISNKITALYQDYNDDLWIGTEKSGLSIYNITTNTFDHIDRNNSNLLSSNRISCLYEDNKKQMWVGMWQGVGFDRVNKYNKTAQNFAIDPNTRKKDWYNSIIQDQDGTIWLGVWGAAGFHAFNPETGRIQDNTNMVSSYPSQTPLYKVLIDSNFVWLASNTSSVFNLNTNNRSYSIYNSINSKNWNKPNFYYWDVPKYDFVVDVINDINEGIWISTNTSVFKIMGDNNIEIAFKSKNDIRSIGLNHDKDSLLIATNDNIILHDLNSKKQKKQKKLPFDIESVFCDLYHYWVVSSENRLYKLKIENNSIEILYETDPFKYKINDAIFQGEEIILATDHGILVWDVNKSEVIKDFQENEIHAYSIYKLSDKRFLIGTDIGLYIFNELSNEIYNYKLFNEEEDLRKYQIYDIDVFNSIIWLGTDVGLIRINDKTKRLSKYNEIGTDRVVSNLVTVLTEDNKRNIWIGTSNSGVSKYNIDSHIFTHYLTSQNLTSISSNAINTIFQDSKDNIWIGGVGLNLYSPLTNDFIVYTDKDGLSDNNVMGILEDDNGNLWISTKFGLSVFDPETNKFQNFYESDGLQSNEFSKAAFKLESGELCFGGNNGFNIFDPDKLVFNVEQPSVQISDFKLFNKSIAKDLTIDPEIELEYDENFFTIEFTSLDFSSVKNNKYKYKLNGVDQEWVAISSDNKASYTKINPGTYTFEVFGTNNDGIWSKNSAKIQVIIKPPFFLNKWFLGFFISLIITLIAYLIWLTNSRYKFFEAKLKTEQKMLRSQMNPHFIFNSLIAIQAFIFKGNAEEASRYLSNFSKLMRLNLNSLRDDFVSLAKELELIDYYIGLQSLRFEGKFKYKVVVDQRIDKELMYIPPMFLQPFIENSIEHGLIKSGKNGLIEVRIHLKEKLLDIEITDNGIGINKSKEIFNKSEENNSDYNSYATEIAEDRLSHLGKLNKIKTDFEILNLYNKNGESIGTRVHFTVPYLIKT